MWLEEIDGKAESRWWTRKMRNSRLHTNKAPARHRWGGHGHLRGWEEPQATSCFNYIYIFPNIFFIFLILFCFLFFVIVLLLFFFFFFFFATPHGLQDRGFQAGGQAELLWWEPQVQTAGLTEKLRPQGILIGVRHPKGPYLSTKTWLYLTACKLQCWTTQAKQPVRQEYSPTHQKKKKKGNDKKICYKASLVVQWLRIHLPMQRTWVRALVQEDPTCC